jgi:hypothetical protein
MSLVQTGHSPLGPSRRRCQDEWGSYEEQWKTLIRKEWGDLALDVSGFAPFTNDVCILSENVKPKSNVPKVFGR